MNTENQKDTVSSTSNTATHKHPKKKANKLKAKWVAKVVAPMKTSDLPKKTLEESIKCVTPIHETYADGNVTWDELAVALNLSPKGNEFKYQIWSAQAYGLIIKDGDKYHLSETAKKIFTPESPTEKKDSLVKATTIPNILSRFYTDYNGKLLPDGEYFVNVLMSRYTIPKEKVDEAKDLIIANAKFAGLLNEHESGKRTIRLDGAPIKEELTTGEIETSNDDFPAKPLSDKENVCFYITPIGDEGTETRKHADMMLRHLIEPAFKEFNYTVVRADKIEKSGLITQQIFEHLIQSKICVADLSYGNANAFYELGIRHMAKKPTIQIIRKGDKIPFDVSQGRTINVDVSDVFTIMDKMESARKELSEHIKAIIEGSAQSEDNPVAVYLPNLVVKFT